ncbi:MAG: hypothetical protein JKY02_00320 [Flavobacteriaceae bacterium]|nr:hypothetical protein [Flavobacteriaceae bacterium]
MDHLIKEIEESIKSRSLSSNDANYGSSVDKADVVYQATRNNAVLQGQSNPENAVSTFGILLAQISERDGLTDGYWISFGAGTQSLSYNCQDNKNIYKGGIFWVVGNRLGAVWVPNNL